MTLTDHDRREVLAFKRFLALGIRPDDHGCIPRKFPGWLPYVLGWGPPPPEGLDDVPVAAWTMPGHDPQVAWWTDPYLGLPVVLCPGLGVDGWTLSNEPPEGLSILDAEPGRR